MEKIARRHRILAVIQTNLPLAALLIAGGVALLVFGTGRIADLAAGALLGLGIPVVLSRIFS